MNKLMPILWTKNLQETISFYENVLGFKCHGSKNNFASLTNGDVEVMFIVPDTEHSSAKPLPNPGLTGSLYIWMPNLEEFWEAIKDKVKVTTTIAEREYNARDFSIIDNNGYELVFGEDNGTK